MVFGVVVVWVFAVCGIEDIFGRGARWLLAVGMAAGAAALSGLLGRVVSRPRVRALISVLLAFAVGSLVALREYASPITLAVTAVVGLLVTLAVPNGSRDSDE